MSAVIGILNKNAAALAADSAVTISGGTDRKIYNTANKLFTLSKYHPVGVMVYSSSSFMGTPWEVLIKVYRENLGDKSFDTLEQYHIDFVEFLKKKNCFSSKEEQKVFLKDYIVLLFETLNNGAFAENKSILADPQKYASKINQVISDEANNYLGNILPTIEEGKEFHDYDEDDFYKFANDLINEASKKVYDQNGFKLNGATKKLLRKVSFEHIKSQHYLYHTGLVFVGYGDNEIYPHLIPLNISNVVDGRLRYHIDENRSAYISDVNLRSVAICPFAQHDVIDTILYGIDPDFKQVQEKNFDKFFKKYKNLILKKVEKESPKLAKEIKSFDTSKLLDEFKKSISEVQTNQYVLPLYRAVSSLSKEDLAEMAESLINLTYLKRRITFNEESVGGPVDVALITKGDGFIWIKRKHYFDPELNHHFFQNYLNHG